MEMFKIKYFEKEYLDMLYYIVHANTIEEAKKRFEEYILERFDEDKPTYQISNMKPEIDSKYIYEI